MLTNKTLNFLGYRLFVGNISELSGAIPTTSKRIIVNTINPHSYVVAKNEPRFANALNEADFVVPDGSGIVLGVKIRNKLKIERIAGFDVFELLMNRANSEGLKVFFLGASAQTLVAIQKKAAVQYPSAIVKTYSPPFKAEFSVEENKEMISIVNEFEPDILFVGMTAPKQEKWLADHKKKLNFGVGSCIGAVFDFYAGNVKRPSLFWQKLGLEWLPRLFAEPKRLWRRMVISAPIHLWDVITK